MKCIGQDYHIFMKFHSAHDLVLGLKNIDVKLLKFHSMTSYIGEAPQGKRYRSHRHASSHAHAFTIFFLCMLCDNYVITYILHN